MNRRRLGPVAAILGGSALAATISLDKDVDTHNDTAQMQVSNDSRPWRVAVSTHRDPANLLSMDHVLVQADVIGEFRVERALESKDRSSILVEVTPIALWIDRQKQPGPMTFAVAAEAWGDFRELLIEGRRIVAFASGGTWTTSSFTYDHKSVFAVADDDTVLCESGNPLFGVSSSGFRCSIQEYMASSPLSVAEMKLEVEVARARAVRRMPELALQLDTRPRPMIQQPYTPTLTP